MKLKDSEWVWAPEDSEEYILPLQKNRQLPKNPELFLLEQVELLKRLVAEANPGEIEEANRSLVNNLNEDQLLWLPPEMLKAPQGPRSLLLNPAPYGSRLWEWKDGIEEAMAQPQMPQEEARELAKSLCLETFLSPLL